MNLTDKIARQFPNGQRPNLGRFQRQTKIPQKRLAEILAGAEATTLEFMRLDLALDLMATDPGIGRPLKVPGAIAS